ncbi:MAG: hypothetical protein Q8P20_11170 [bacterium]|nr:hypothetical protein [bacterium]
MLNKLRNFLKLSRGKEISDLTGLAEIIHNKQHEIDGIDGIDANKLKVDFSPINYIPSSIDYGQLISHLSGIDNKFSSIGLLSISSNLEENIFSTTSNIFQDANILNFNLSESNLYKISWNYTWNAIKNNRLLIEINIDNTQSILTNKHYGIFINNEDSFSENGNLEVYLNNGIHNIYLKVKSEILGKEIKIFLSRLEISSV